MTTKAAVDSKNNNEPSRPLTMVFADIVDFTDIMSEVGDLAALDASKEFLSCAHQLQQIHQGRIIKVVGDTFLAIFEEVGMAMHFATDLLRTLHQNPVYAGGRQIVVKMSLHLGSVRLIKTTYGEDVFGLDVNLAARLIGFALPNQVVVSDTAFLALPKDLQTLLEPMGSRSVRGFRDSLQVHRLAVAGE